MDQIAILMEKAIINYFERNKFYPENIILYRDGVGESQFLAIQNVEVKNIIDVFKRIGDKYKFNFTPKFMEIIVQKKINERFFLQTNKGLDNPNSGTVICEQTVSTKYWDFYLVAQKVT